MDTMKASVGLLGCLAVVALFLAACDEAAPPDAGGASATASATTTRKVLQLGDAAPDFQLRDMEGRLVSLEQQRGKVVLLNFWATWCGPCRVEMPAMEQLYRSLSRRDFEILAVSTDPQGAAVTRPFQRELKLSFPILHDADFRVGLTFGARTLPMTFLIDRQGIIRERIFGALDWHSPEATRAIQMLMNQA
jgi:peroxiredoxin